MPKDPDPPSPSKPAAPPDGTAAQPRGASPDVGVGATSVDRAGRGDPGLGATLAKSAPPARDEIGLGATLAPTTRATSVDSARREDPAFGATLAERTPPLRDATPNPNRDVTPNPLRDVTPNPRMDATTAGSVGGADPTFNEASRDSESSSFPALSGYEIKRVIGRGGMGEVALAHDDEIGREIAIKRLRTSQASPEGSARFMREARIQARLEHPAIVPVHEIGRDANGQPFFTMKRVTGRTLAEVLSLSAPQQRQKILRAFAEVCRAVEFAHTRHVVHRDLKPANVMLGDYGEVYVLDWGLARVVGDEEKAAMAEGVVSLDGTTQAGSLLGTPGYMAPEQIESAHDVGTAADIYSLGSILFEILAGEALHGKAGQILTSTLAGVDAGPAKRRPDKAIPLELDALCLEALHREPPRRPSARELAERVEGYLDGDRDTERRRSLAAAEVRIAQDALATGEPARRADAMKAAGRALALDPESRDAADLITALMLEPPKEHPIALRDELVATEVAVQKRHGRVAMGSFAAVILFLGLSAWNGLQDWVLLAAITGVTIIQASIAFVVSRREMSSREILLVTCGNALLVALLSRMFGSLLIAPAVTCVMALSLTSYPQNIDRGRTVVAVLVLSWMGPVVLEWLGVLDPTWKVVEGAVISMSSMVKIGGTATVALLVFANVMTIIVFGLFANKLAMSRRDAQRQVEIQAWHLKQLLPN